MSKLVLIDGNAIMHRAYHALPNTLTSKKGEPINAVYGLTSMLLKIIEDLQPTHIAFCFDRKEPTFRHIEFKEYQSHRPETDKDLASQFDIAKKVIDSFGIKSFEKAGYEADDVIGTLAKLATESGRVEEYKSISKKLKRTPALPLSRSSILIDEVIIVTGDRDQMQLINDKVKLYMPVGGLTNAKLFGEKDVEEKMGVKPDQIIDYKALVGDPSDNYPGIYGIGPKTAINLLKEYKSYENVIANIENLPSNISEKIIANKTNGDISYRLARIITDVDVAISFDDLDDWKVGSEKNIEVFEEIGFKTLTQRVKGEKDFAINNKPSLDQIKRVSVKIAKLLKGKQYAIRGTASLVLQGLTMGVDDVDVLCDKHTALAFNDLFKDFLKEKVEYKESDKFKSYFGKFVINEVLVEVYGEWQIRVKERESIRAGEKSWSKIYNAGEGEIMTLEVGGQQINVTKVETELEVSAAMGRWNEHHKIKRQIAKKDQQSLF